MTAHAGHVGVNEYGCRALSNLAWNDANKVTIVAAGAIPVILEAMTAHAGHEGVNECGCRALANLASNNANRVTMAEAGAIPDLLNAMKVHAGHMGVNEQGCRALGNIGWSDPAIQQIVKVLSSSPTIPIPSTLAPLTAFITQQQPCFQCYRIAVLITCCILFSVL